MFHDAYYVNDRSSFFRLDNNQLTNVLLNTTLLHQNAPNLLGLDLATNSLTEVNYFIM